MDDVVRLKSSLKNALLSVDASEGTAMVNDQNSMTIEQLIDVIRASDRAISPNSISSSLKQIVACWENLGSLDQTELNLINTLQKRLAIRGTLQATPLPKANPVSQSEENPGPQDYIMFALIQLLIFLESGNFNYLNSYLKASDLIPQSPNDLVSEDRLLYGSMLDFELRFYLECMGK